MKIGFDLDGVLIDKPPILPRQIIDLVYRNQSARKLTYRVPSRPEQYLRILSHYSFFRPSLFKNIHAIKNIQQRNDQIFLVSGRFEFLKNRTSSILKKYNLDNVFKEIHINLENNQPHLFKEKIINKLGIKRYVDDDIHLLLFLAKNNKNIEFYWIENPIDKNIFALPKNITPIKDLEEFYKNYL